MLFRPSTLLSRERRAEEPMLERTSKSAFFFLKIHLPAMIGVIPASLTSSLTSHPSCFRFAWMSLITPSRCRVRRRNPSTSTGGSTHCLTSTAKLERYHPLLQSPSVLSGALNSFNLPFLSANHRWPWSTVPSLTPPWMKRTVPTFPPPSDPTNISNPSMLTYSLLSYRMLVILLFNKISSVARDRNVKQSVAFLCRG